MSVNKLLLWEKWRPKTMEDLVMLPRIRKQFENGISQNYIFHGSYGTGKTTLARILIGRYTKDRPYLEINSSLYTSIDVLRTEIEDFCKFSSMMETESDIKYVFLDEFERVSNQFQDAFKAFIERYNKNVRFIITTNHLNRVSDGIKSRIAKIDFDFQTPEEEKYLKVEIYKRINKIILPAEGNEIPKDDLVSIITKKFPDFRSVMVEVQNYLETGSLICGSSNVTVKIKEDLYHMIYDNSYDYEKIYHFLMTRFGPEKIDLLFNLLGRSFITWSIDNKKNVDKLFQCNNIISDYNSKLETNTDPIVLAMTVIGKFRGILN
jgi:DNA polymerase III delta prime subunit